ncbi:hypothetical protein CERZMDRAFT_93657 [Cercospora zeae-maydis SCOH1-5]|uniref:Uncharacterized protein n=1 Tax=Cercospora zeae-maydis SCOH1-5 TaxID=717836 RepID=A0A6A6FSG9_9PEZI|nr:hypothetical protein CERZMDRAFT_93657 [Cercospora zeae-maydis SCOH1-5]
MRARQTRPSLVQYQQAIAMIRPQEQSGASRHRHDPNADRSMPNTVHDDWRVRSTEGGPEERKSNDMSSTPFVKTNSISESPTSTGPDIQPSLSIATTGPPAANRAASDPFGSAALLVHESTIQALSGALVWRRATGLLEDEIVTELERRLERFGSAECRKALAAAEQRFRDLSSLAGMDGSKERAMEAVRIVRKLAEMLETVAGGKYVELSRDMHDLATRLGE